MVTQLQQTYKQSDRQWLLNEYTDPNVVLSFSAFEFQVAIADLYENISFEAINSKL